MPAADKPAGYYAQTRDELVARLPRPLGRVLDVGCGEGGAAGPLRAAGAEELVGIEIHPPAAERAAGRYDRVHTGAVEEVLLSLGGGFDTILCYDVLEHLVDPGAVLGGLRSAASPGARLHVSTPNARHWSLVRDLVLRGTFGYTEFGHRDATHLRWFTRADLVALLGEHGWAAREVWPGRLRPVSRAAARLTRGMTADFLAVQWAVLAQREG